MTYQPGKPLPGDLLSDSQGDIKDNFTVANTVMTVDHYPFDDVSTNKGYHKATHIVKQVGGVNPPTVAGTQILFAKDYTPDTSGGTADTQLFSKTGAGGLSQLTGNSASSDGWCWMGGVLIQWGRVTGISGTSTQTGTVTFKNRSAGAIPFPTQCFSVTTTCAFTGSTPSGAASVVVKRSTLSATKFDWVFNSNSSAYDSFFWMAIGN